MVVPRVLAIVPDRCLLRCGNCTFVVLAKNEDRAKAAMLDHLQYVHTEGHPDGEAA